MYNSASTSCCTYSMACQNYRVRCIKLFRTLCSRINCRCMYMHTRISLFSTNLGYYFSHLIHARNKFLSKRNKIKIALLARAFSLNLFTISSYLFLSILRPSIVHMHELAHRRNGRTLKYNFPKRACMIDLRLARAYIPHLITLHYTRYIVAPDLMHARIHHSIENMFATHFLTFIFRKCKKFFALFKHIRTHTTHIYTHTYTTRIHVFFLSLPVVRM